MKRQVEFGAALLAQVVGAATVLLLGTRAWQTLTVHRPGGLAQLVVSVNGRTVDAAPTAFALVALAGVVAVLATKGVTRRVIGGLVALAGVALLWRCTSAIAAVSTARARELVRDKHPGGIESVAVVPHVTTHPVWGLLSLAAGVLVLLAGVMIALRGGLWAAMSARYESPRDLDPADAERSRARATASLWTALERGEDPTAHDPQDAQ